MVFYRKYRPQTIAELDSPKLRETLTAVLSQKDIPHAFLFTGSKGLGKTSTARIIAKVINCTGGKRNGIEPCNVCEECISITNGSNIDVLEIDGASNRGIDEIRELRQGVNLAPVSAKMKVYIIDEVHMLTNEAFNALLKTIEEPPLHVMFIFATTEPQKVPATIISRCFHISLARATEEELTHALKRIVQEEKIEIDEDVLPFIAKKGDGGYRDTTKILEEVVAIANGKKITKELFESIFKTAGIESNVEELLTFLKSKDAAGALKLIEEIGREGIDIRQFLFSVLILLHERLLACVEKKNEINEFSLTDLQTLLVLFGDAYKNTKYAVISSLPLELAIVTWCQSSNTSRTNEVSGEDRGAIESSESKRAGITMKDALKKEQTLKVKQVLAGTKVVPIMKQADPSIKQTDLPKDVKDYAVFLENIIYKVKQKNVSVAGVLRSVVVQSVSDTEVVLQTAYTFHKERLEDSKARALLEQVMKEITGKTLKLTIVLKTK